MADRLAQLAAEITKLRAEIRTRAKVRVASVTAVENTTERRVRLDISGSYWAATDTDAPLAVNDRVYALEQGNTWTVVGRLDGVTVSPPVGSIVGFGGWVDATPPGWLPCDGRSLSRTEYPELYGLLGINYGSASSTTFNLPQLLGRFPVGAGGDGSLFWLGKTGGAERVTLTTAQLPAHSHTIAHTHTVASGAGGATVASGSGATVASSPTATTSAPSNASSGDAGSGQSHENMPPYLGVVYMIRVR